MPLGLDRHERYEICDPVRRCIVERDADDGVAADLPSTDHPSLNPATCLDTGLTCAPHLSVDEDQASADAASDYLGGSAWTRCPDELRDMFPDREWMFDRPIHDTQWLYLKLPNPQGVNWPDRAACTTSLFWPASPGRDWTYLVSATMPFALYAARRSMDKGYGTYGVIRIRYWVGFMHNFSYWTQWSTERAVYTEYSHFPADPSPERGSTAEMVFDVGARPYWFLQIAQGVSASVGRRWSSNYYGGSRYARVRGAGATLCDRAKLSSVSFSCNVNETWKSWAERTGTSVDGSSFYYRGALGEDLLEADCAYGWSGLDDNDPELKYGVKSLLGKMLRGEVVIPIHDPEAYLTRPTLDYAKEGFECLFGELVEPSVSIDYQPYSDSRKTYTATSRVCLSPNRLQDVGPYLSRVMALDTGWQARMIWQFKDVLSIADDYHAF